MIVQFDVDGVLADFIGGFCRVYAREHGCAFPIPYEVIRWDDLWNEEVWAHIKGSDSFWRELPSLATQTELERIARLAYDWDTVYFVTNRPGRFVHFQTVRWLEKRSIFRPTVIVTAKKAEFAVAAGVDYAIDDKAGNAVAIQYIAPKTKSYLLDAPYNRFDHAVLGSKVIRVKAVSEFLDAVTA